MRLVAAILLLAASQAYAQEASDPNKSRALFESLERDPAAFSLVGDPPRLSFHKSMYVLPFSYSPDFPGDDTEVVFQISLKQQLFKRRLFFAYTQRSFWQLYDGKDSRPFRETNYNPELFLRWKQLGGTRWGVDVGADHESNGKPLPDSRSWNRLFVGGFNESGNHLAYFKLWWRLPEQAREAPDDPKGDDNPDIERFYGYGELTLQRKFFADQHMASLMLRANPATGRGAVNLVYSAPFGNYAFWNLYLWQGYGESLADYDREVTRLGVGLMLAR